MGIQMVTDPRAVQNTSPLVLYQIEPDISTPGISAFVLGLFEHISNGTAVRVTIFR